MEQLPLSTDMVVAEYRESARSALSRVTAKWLAGALRLTEDGVRNQYRLWTPRNHPCGVGAFLLQYQDAQHGVEVAGLCGKEIVPKRATTPGEALRELEARAAKGFVSAEELRNVLARTRLEEPREATFRAVPR